MAAVIEAAKICLPAAAASAFSPTTLKPVIAAPKTAGPASAVSKLDAVATTGFKIIIAPVSAVIAMKLSRTGFGNAANCLINSVALLITGVTTGNNPCPIATCKLSTAF